MPISPMMFDDVPYAYISVLHSTSTWPYDFYGGREYIFVLRSFFIKFVSHCLDKFMLFLVGLFIWFGAYRKTIMLSGANSSSQHLSSSGTN